MARWATHHGSRLRRIITPFFRLCLRIYFRRIEIIGLQRISDQSAVIFAANHPNGLVDPLFLLCFTPRPVSFLGKAPLLRHLLIGWIVRAFDTIPVYRKQDAMAGTNRETFSRAREVLDHGGSIAIFPEGTTHDDPRLRELKTGAARIALGSSLDDLAIVPVGIYYTAKHVFRSSALVIFGDPIRVQPVGVDEEGEPPRDAVDHLTETIDAALDSLTLQADSHAALELIARAEDLFSADDQQPLWEELDLRRRFIDGYHALRRRDPARLSRLESMIRQFDTELRGARLEVHDLKARISFGGVLRIVVLLPLALAGVVVSYPAWRLVGWLAKRFSKGEGALMGTMKLVAALAFYPLTWLLLSIGVWFRAGGVFALAALVVFPLLSYVALRVFEEMDDIGGDLRAIVYRAFRREGHARLLEQQQAIREELLNLASWL